VHLPSPHMALDVSGEVCSLRKHCLKLGEQRRTLLVKRKQLIRAEMRARLKQPEKQAIYWKRKWVAEQVFGQIKGGLGFRDLTIRGQDLARAQWLFVCAVHNVMKTVRHISSLKGKETALLISNEARKPAFSGLRPDFFSFSDITAYGNQHLVSES